jgi:hypothetical protein
VNLIVGEVIFNLGEEKAFIDKAYMPPQRSGLGSSVKRILF